MMVQTEKMMTIGGLAAGMAHEINNPLSTILQGCQNIQRRLSPKLPSNQTVAKELGIDLAKVYAYLEKRNILRFLQGIQDAGVRATNIVTDMLAFSRRSKTELSPARLDELLDTVIRLAASDYDLKKKYDFRQIAVIRDYDRDLGAVYCDRTEIEQVLLNLVRNAAQAIAAGGVSNSPRIILRTRRAGDSALIEVEDNGPGMDQKTRLRVFEPFYTTKPIGAGTGLGLSVSYFIITERHQGDISVSSVPGQGSCFTIRLPLSGKGNFSNIKI
jgi:signal transduction histidine kinase